MDIVEKDVLLYKDALGIAPFEEWLHSLRDQQARNIVRTRLARVRLGNLGDVRNLGGGVFELRIDFGPGYRIYFGQDGQALVILLCGGDKKTQTKDIIRAHDYWLDYRRRTYESRKKL